MTAQAIEERVPEILRDLKKYGAIRALAAVVPMSYRTLYRHAEDDAERRPELKGENLLELSELFAELGLLDAYGREELFAAIAEIKRRADMATSGASARAHRHADETRKARRRPPTAQNE